jgi:hypothetical protein
MSNTQSTSSEDQDELPVSTYERLVAKLRKEGKYNKRDLALDTMCCCPGVIMNPALGTSIRPAKKHTILNGLSGSTKSTHNIVVPDFGLLKFIEPVPGAPIYNIVGWKAAAENHFIRYYYHLKAFLLFPKGSDREYIYIFREIDSGYICKGGRKEKSPGTIEDLNRAEDEHLKNAMFMGV